jgi:hypothetical protein
MDSSPIELGIQQWAATPRLERAEGTKINRMREAIRPDNLISAGKLSHDVENNLEKFIGTIIWDRIEGRALQILVVEHDWSTAFAHAGEEIGEHDYRLPYPFCLFEFRISGRRVGIVAFQRQESEYELHGLLEEPEIGAWVYLNLKSPQMAAVDLLVGSQVRAVCIALEAEVAETEVIRAPLKLNKARERRGKLPIPDYRTVRLSRRTRLAPLLSCANDTEEAEKRRSPRLHFRRGHWAHFAHHRTWRKWTLVGNPDLGFIDKHYRL